MWYRVEFNRDGGVRECRQVEARGTESGLVTYVDADSNTSAVVNALAWRKAYLEAARRNQAASRERMRKIGVCRSCHRRKMVKGKLLCRVCLDAEVLRRKGKYTVIANVTPSEETVTAVAARIRENHGKSKASDETIAAAIRGESVSVYIAAPVARALREVGFIAAIHRNGAPVKRGGRYSLNNTELEMLLAVRVAFQGMTKEKFGVWLDKEIGDREERRDAESKRTSEAA